MVDIFHTRGTTQSLRDHENSLLETTQSWEAQDFKIRPLILAWEKWTQRPYTKKASNSKELLKSLKNTLAELQLIFLRVARISIVLFFPLTAMSSVAAEKLCLIERVIPKYLYELTLFSPKLKFSTNWHHLQKGPTTTAFALEISDLSTSITRSWLFSTDPLFRVFSPSQLYAGVAI